MGVRLLAGAGNSFFTAALESTQPPVQGVPGALFLGIKQPGREVDNSPTSIAEVKESVELYLYSLPQYVFKSRCLVKHRDNFTFTCIE
jgi:hypothetical protein